MKPPPPIAPPSTVALRLKSEIERAASEGVRLDDMTLHLTLSDVFHLKRDRDVPLADISFADGTMRYLGVKIVKGNVELSVLRHAAESP